MRQRQEVQALPRQGLTVGSRVRDFSDDARADAQAPRATPPPTSRSTSCARAGPSLETEASRPDLWDDADVAKRGHRRAERRSSTTSSCYERLVRPSSRTPRRSHELAREEDDESARSPRSRRRLDALDRELDGLELRSLFTGEHDERDAICAIHSGAGGTDAQDWAEMLLPHVHALGRAPRVRGRARRGRRRLRGRASSSADLHREGPLRLRAACRPSAACTGSCASRPFNAQGKRQTAFAALDVVPVLARGRGAGRDRRDGPARSTSTARRAPAASTSTSPSRPCASPTCRPASSCRARTSARQHQNKDRAMQILKARLADLRAPEARGRAGRHPGRAAAGRLRQPDPQLRAAAVPDGEGPPHRARDRQRAGRARRRPRPFMEAYLHWRARATRLVVTVIAMFRRPAGVPAIGSEGAGTLASAHDQARERHQGLQGRGRRPARRHRRHREGRVRLPRRRRPARASPRSSAC